MTLQAWSSAQLCQTLCDTTDRSTPGFPVLLYLPQFAQTHVHSVGDAIQLRQPLSPLLLLPSIFPGIRIFSTVTSSHQVAKVLGPLMPCLQPEICMAPVHWNIPLWGDIPTSSQARWVAWLLGLSNGGGGGCLEYGLRAPPNPSFLILA